MISRYTKEENGTAEHGLGARVVLDLCAPLLGITYDISSCI